MHARIALFICLLIPAISLAQAPPEVPRTSGLSAQLDPLSELHLQQIERFRTPPATSTRQISSGTYALPLPERETDFSGLSYSIDGQAYSIDDFMSHNHVGGLLVLKNGENLLERYGLGNTEETVWIGYSVAKTVTSLLFGAAIADGFIPDLDALVTDYLPPLKDSAYEGVTLRNLLQMASGVQWNEDYADPNSDVGTYPGGNAVRLLKFLADKPREAPPGERFNYSTGETDLAGIVLRAAIGNNLSTYLEHKLWKHMMGSPAYWATHGSGGGERGGCCTYATLRDYGRIGQFVLNDGVLPDGTRVLPEGWIAESTAPSPASDGYGYFWWLEGEGRFRASGIYGQGIYINPENDLVIAVLSSWTAASGPEYAAHRDSLFAVIDEFLR